MQDASGDRDPAADLAWARLFAAHETVAKTLDRALLPLGISAIQAMALAFIAESREPATPTRIADALAQETQSMTGLVDRLEARGWVQRTRDLGDRRVIRVTLTPAGEAKLAETTAPMATALEQSIGTLSVAEAATLAALLVRLQEPGR